MPGDGERLARRPDAIRAMFAGVSRRYDLLNHLLSARRDVAWRRLLVGAVVGAPPGPALDLATGTGDVALALESREVMGADFTFEMLWRARAKTSARGRRIPFAAADALALPFRPASFAAVTVAFGVRNFADLGDALAQIRSVLKPRGLLAVLEFQRPPSRWVRAFMAAWNTAVVVPLGRLLSDDAAAYAYLPQSVGTFPDARGLGEAMSEAGFTLESCRELSGGIAALTVARKEMDE